MGAVSFGDSIRGLVEDGIPWAFLTAAVLVLVLTPLVATIAPRIGGVDQGGDRPRVHTEPVPRIGGVAIVVAILAAAALWADIDGPYIGMLLGTGLVALVGLYDDIHGLRPSAKLGAVMVVALCMNCLPFFASWPRGGDIRSSWDGADGFIHELYRAETLAPV